MSIIPEQIDYRFPLNKKTMDESSFSYVKPFIGEDFLEITSSPSQWIYATCSGDATITQTEIFLVHESIAAKEIWVYRNIIPHQSLRSMTGKTIRVEKGEILCHPIRTEPKQSPWRLTLINLPDACPLLCKSYLNPIGFLNDRKAIYPEDTRITGEVLAYASLFAAFVGMTLGYISSKE